VAVVQYTFGSHPVAVVQHTFGSHTVAVVQYKKTQKHYAEQRN
jgi:hypothetical protein